MRLTNQSSSLDTGTLVARRARKATGLHRSSPGYRRRYHAGSPGWPSGCQGTLQGLLAHRKDSHVQPHPFQASTTLRRRPRRRARISGRPGAASQAAEVEPALGTAYDYSVLAARPSPTPVSTTAAGDLGVSPGTTRCRFDNGTPRTVGGASTLDDAQSLQAQVDLTTATTPPPESRRTLNKTGQDLGWPDLASPAPTPGPETSRTPAPSRSTPRAIRPHGSSSRWPGTWPPAPASGAAGARNLGLQHLLAGGQRCRASAVATTFVGTIMANNCITVGTGTTVEGRALARNAAVTLDTNTFTSPACDQGPAHHTGHAASIPGQPRHPAAAEQRGKAGNLPAPGSAAISRRPQAGRRDTTRRGTSGLRRTRAEAARELHQRLHRQGTGLVRQERRVQPGRQAHLH